MPHPEILKDGFGMAFWWTRLSLFRCLGSKDGKQEVMQVAAHIAAGTSRGFGALMRVGEGKVRFKVLYIFEMEIFNLHFISVKCRVYHGNFGGLTCDTLEWPTILESSKSILPGWFGQQISSSRGSILSVTQGVLAFETPSVGGWNLMGTRKRLGTI